MKADTAAWTGSDGVIAPSIFIDGNHGATMRVVKESGLFYLDWERG